MKELKCNCCGTLVATLRDASVMIGIVCYCPSCANPIPQPKPMTDDFGFNDLFGDIFNTTPGGKA